MELLNIGTDLFSEAEIEAEAGSVVTGLREIGVHWHDPLAPALSARVVVRGWQGSPYAVFSWHGFLQPNPTWQFGSHDPRLLRHHLALMIQIHPAAAAKVQILAEAVATRVAVRLTNAPRELVEKMLTKTLVSDDTAARVEAEIAALAAKVDEAEKSGNAVFAASVARAAGAKIDALKAKFAGAAELGSRKLIIASDAIDDGRVIANTHVEIRAMTYTWPYDNALHCGYKDSRQTAEILRGTQSTG